MFLKKSHEQYVVIASGDSVYRMNYRDVLEYHASKKADITVVYKPVFNKDLTKLGIMNVDETGRVVDFEEKPLEPQTNNASLGIYVISRMLLIKLLEEIVPEGRYDLVKDIIIRFRRKLNIYGYEFDGYWSSVGGGISDYYQTNMDFLKKEVRDIFVKEYPYITTKLKDEPPVKYNGAAEVKNSISGGGTIINGKVENSVLFRRTFIGENTTVKNSIIMEGSYIGNNCIVDNAIFDKNVVVSDGRQIIGDSENPVVLKKGTVL